MGQWGTGVLGKAIMWVLMGKHELDAQGTEINKHLLPPQNEITATEAFAQEDGDTMLASIKKQSNLLLSRPA